MHVMHVNSKNSNMNIQEPDSGMHNAHSTASNLAKMILILHLVFIVLVICTRPAAGEGTKWT